VRSRKEEEDSRWTVKGIWKIILIPNVCSWIKAKTPICTDSAKAYIYLCKDEMKRNGFKWQHHTVNHKYLTDINSHLFL
jgi:hypothetical protein